MCVRAFKYRLHYGAGTVCRGPACRFDKLMAHAVEGSNTITVSVTPQTVGVATAARFRLKVENVADSFSECEDQVCFLRRRNALQSLH